MRRSLKDIQFSSGRALKIDFIRYAYKALNYSCITVHSRALRENFYFFEEILADIKKLSIIEFDIYTDTFTTSLNFIKIMTKYNQNFWNGKFLGFYHESFGNFLKEGFGFFISCYTSEYSRRSYQC